MLKTLINEEIYLINEQLNKIFNDSQQYLPAKVKCTNTSMSMTRITWI